jgi:hypothetical protein
VKPEAEHRWHDGLVSSHYRGNTNKNEPKEARNDVTLKGTWDGRVQV